MTPEAVRRRRIDLALIALVGYAVVFIAPPLAHAGVVDTVRALLTGEWNANAAAFAFDFAKYVEGGQAVAAGLPGYSVDGYIYTNLLARITAAASGVVPDARALTALHQLFVCALWPWLAVLAAWGFRSPAFRWGVAGVVWAATAFRGAAELGNIDFEVLLLLLFAYRLMRAGRAVPTGILIGALAAAKPFAGLFAIPYAVRLVRARGRDRAAWAVVVGTGAAFVLLLATDPVINWHYLTGAASEDISGRCRGVGLGSVLVASGAACSTAVGIALLAGTAFVAAFAWWATNDRQRWSLAGLGQPLVNALTSDYVLGYGIFAAIHGAERLEEGATTGAPPRWPDAALFGGAIALILGTNFTGVGIGGTLVGAWSTTVGLVALGAIAVSRRPA